MKRKILVVMMTLTMATGLFAGCNNEVPKDVVPTTKPTEAVKKAPSGNLKKVHTAVKNAYGEQYIPSMALDETAFQELIGVKKELFIEYIAEMPMMSTHVDTFIGVEAKEGKAKEVEALLLAYREKLVSDTMQYPMNVPKIQASKVVAVDDYVFFVLLGEIPMEVLDTGDEAKIKNAAESGVKKAIDAINAALGKK
jgi:hypothetical protein